MIVAMIPIAIALSLIAGWLHFPWYSCIVIGYGACFGFYQSLIQKFIKHSSILRFCG